MYKYPVRAILTTKDGQCYGPVFVFPRWSFRNGRLTKRGVKAVEAVMKSVAESNEAEGDRIRKEMVK